MLQIIALLITITALFSYVNFRFFRLPTTIGVMVLGPFVRRAFGERKKN
ncbi:MAG TPA: hypothetical protein VG146_16770 [Verrucomicrobiae bacterium]|nr:hypothetical protein [Verrucomicrobiae bacterium]